MFTRLLPLLLAAGAAVASGAIVDRIAIIVGNRAIKTSDIEREVRMTAFINGETLDLSAAARRKAAERLIDQAIIRRELEIGAYPAATDEEADRLLAEIKRQRFGTTSRYEAALREYGITEQQLRRQLLWQLTVLHFIEARFRPGVLVRDEELQSQYEKQYRGKANAPALDKVRGELEEQLIGERVNQQFYAWLDEARKQVKPQYLEGALS